MPAFPHGALTEVSCQHAELNALRHAIFTHCGTLVVSKAAEAERQISALALTQRIEVQVAYDGLQIVVR
jgi:hypothetical protein